MSVRNLAGLFEPASVAVIGASNRPHSVGNVVMRNLLEGGFDGPIMPVNPRRRAVAGVLTYPDVAGLPEIPDLAVICTPPATVPGIVDELGRRGSRAAIVVTGGMQRTVDADGRTLEAATVAAAKPFGLRIVGSNSLGLLVPRIGLNASFSQTSALAGKVAFVSQSGALCEMVLDWARPKGIGFSHFVSLGSSSDIGFDDLLDYLAGDPTVRAILLYIESIRERRNFMAAARAAARNKPVLAIKAGLAPPEGEEQAPPTLSGVVAEPDQVFDAALRRAGVLRVHSIDELFGAVETLARARPVRGDRLAVLANGGGAGVMAADELQRAGGQLARLSQRTSERLCAMLPAGWRCGNPIDIQVDAPGKRYADALKLLVEDPDVDAVLVIHSPTALASAEEAAQAVIKAVREYGGSVLTCWAGAGSVAPARGLFADAGMPTYETPRAAVRAFLHMVDNRRNHEMLMQTPPSLAREFQPDQAAARRVVAEVLAKGRAAMTEPEAKSVLAAYGMNVVKTFIAADAEEAARLADTVGYPVALTVLSPDVSRKWDVGGVALNLENAEAVRAAAVGMIGRVRERMPRAGIEGFTLQRMVSRQNARQIIIAATIDPLFGPVILFGEGGRAVEVLRDHAVGLPPLNLPLARDLVGRTRIHRLLGAYKNRPAADIDAVCLALVQVSQMIVDIPEIVEVDINPLFADDRGVTVVDAHLRVAPFTGAESRRLAIRPYPQDLEEPAKLRDGRTVLLRPIRPEDEPAHQALMEKCTPEDIRYRFFNYVGTLRHSQMARLTQVDYDREMAFVAVVPGAGGAPETLGVARTVTDPDNVTAEFAILVRSDLKGQGLGRLLMDKLIRHARERGTRRISGQVLAENQGMLALARKLGFEAHPLPDGEIVEVVLALG